jgi:O-antigen/teichoic acid export membrane protein
MFGGKNLSQIEDIDFLGKQAVQSGKWAFLARISQILGGSVIFLVLPYWLAPTDFGVITMFSSILALLIIIQQPGLMESIIQREKDPEKIRDAAYWLSVIISLILYLIIFLSAPIIEEFFNQPGLTIPLRVAALQILFLGFTNIPMAWLQRSFRFKSYAFIQLISSLVMIGVSIGLAILGKGFWAYIYGLLSGAFIRLFLVAIFAHWKPSLHFGFYWWGIIIKFGFFVLLEMLLGWLLIWFDNVVVAKNLGSEAAGIYALAFSLSTTVISLPISAITGITLPTFSRLQNNIDILRKYYLLGTKIIATYSIPAGIGFGIIGPTLINLIYPGRWEGLGIIIPILALYAGFGNLWILNTDAFKAIGKPQTMIKIYIPVVLIMIPLYWWGSTIGLLQFTIIRSLVVLISAFPHCYFAIKYLGLKNNYLIEIIYRPILASLFVMLFIWIGNHMLINLRISSVWINIPLLICLIAIGGIIYWIIIKKLEPDFEKEFQNIFRNTSVNKM